MAKHLTQLQKNIVTYLGFFIFSISLYSQNNNQKEVIYQDESVILKDLENASDKFISSENVFFTPEKAKQQLVDSIEKKVSINLLPINKTELSSEDIYQKMKKSTLIIGQSYFCGNCDNVHMNAATGYIISEDGLFVTNHHVVEGFSKDKYSKEGTVLMARTFDGKVYQVKELVTSDKLNDLAILRLETNGDVFTPLALGDEAAVGSDVFVLGHPNSMYYYFSEGMVARNYMFQKDGKTRYQTSVTADYAQGSSGGPVVDKYGNVVATVSNTMSLYVDKRNQKNLQAVVKNTIPVIALKKLLEGEI